MGLEVILSSAIHSKLKHHYGKKPLDHPELVNTWNSLPIKVITSKTEHLQKRLDKYWPESDQELLYDDFMAKIIVNHSDAVNLEAESDEEGPVSKIKTKYN